METELKLPCEWPEDFTYTDEGGLTQEQAEERHRNGRGNVLDSDQGKSLKKILFRLAFLRIPVYVWKTKPALQDSLQ